MNAIETNNLTKFYGKSRGIKDLTFSVREGEIFGFIGPNGAGKSTTIRTLLNYIFPTGGKASVLGFDIVRDSLKIRQNIGYLPSEVNYYDDMRVRDLLNYSAAFYKKDCSGRIRNLSSAMDLDPDKKIEDLSFGNRKKVGIVQALIHEPKLLIFDEPTSGLDPLMQNIFFDILNEERKKGVTVFFSSHILSEVQKMCDRVAIIKEGSIIKIETMETLTQNQFKNITLTFGNDMLPHIDFPGIIKFEAKKNVIKLLFKGDIKAFLQEIHPLDFRDISIEEPSLEDIFIHYYVK